LPWPPASGPRSSTPARFHAMLNATATAYVFKFCERNPKMIKRWPSHVTATRRTRSTIPDDVSQPRLNGKLRAC
jgi:hypothetical protein